MVVILLQACVLFNIGALYTQLAAKVVSLSYDM